MKFETRRWAAIGLVVIVSGCASFPTQRGVKETGELVASRDGLAPSRETAQDCNDARSGTAALVEQPLMPESAVQIALLCNPGLAAEYARLGIANAEAFEAGRLANPSISLGALDSNRSGDSAKLSLGIAQNFTNLILRGPRTRLAEGEFLRAQQLLAGSILTLAVDVKSAYYGLVGAQQIAAARSAIAEAAGASAELAARFRVAGNFSAREFALAQAEAGEADVARRLADDAVISARIELQRLLGLADADILVVPEAIAGPVAEEEALASLREQADAQRLDLAATRKLVELLADSAATTKRLRWLGDFEVGVDYEREADHSRLIGPSLSIQLPLFNQGQGAVARAQSAQAWSEAERRRLTLEVRTSVDLASRHVHSARARVDDYRVRLLPQRAAVVARTQEEVNFMLRGVFELIEARIAEYEAARGYFEALRDYWIARSELERAVGAQLPAQPSVLINAADVLKSAPPDVDHDAMDHGSMNHGSMDHGSMNHGTATPTPAKAAQPATPKPSAPAPENHSHDHHGHDNTNHGEQP
jgi:cobalt-zinc-cadmium efflux system outer membrane protein